MKLRLCVGLLVAAAASLASQVFAIGSVSIDIGPPEPFGCGKVEINGGVGASEGYILRIEWDWGDGTSSESFFPARHQYRADGVYDVTATGYSSSGGSASDTVKVTVDDVGDGSGPRCSPIEMELGPVELDSCGKVTVDGTIAIWAGMLYGVAWDWGDGARSESFPPAEHTYDANGVYEISATPVGSDEGSRAVTVTVEVDTVDDPGCDIVVRLHPTRLALHGGNTSATLRVELRDADGQLLPLAGRSLEFSSGDPDLVQVDGTGTVTATGWGQSVVSVTVDELPHRGSAQVFAGHVRLTPPMLVPTVADDPVHRLTVDAANADGSPLDLSEREVRFGCSECGPDGVATLSENGVLTALRMPIDGSETPHVVASVDCRMAANVMDVRVLAEDIGITMMDLERPHVVFRLPEQLGDYDHRAIFDRWRVMDIMEAAYQLELELTGTSPWDSDIQYMINFFGYGSRDDAPCGLSGNPLRVGTDIERDTNNSCMLVEDMFGIVEPQWGVLLHELGHNFTLDSELFNEFLASAGDDGYNILFAEGLATAVGMWVGEALTREPDRYGLTPDIVDSLLKSWLCWHHDQLWGLDQYLESGADYAQIDPNAINDILFVLVNEHGYELLYRLYSLFTPTNRPQLQKLPALPSGSVEGQATYFVAALSAAAGADLSSRFRDAWGFPVDAAMHETLVPLLEPIVHQRDPAVWPGRDRTVRKWQTVVIDDAEVFDFENDPLQISWRIAELPPFSSAELVGSDTLRPSFQPDQRGRYVLEATVRDARIVGRPATVVINVVDQPRRGQRAPR